MDTVSVRLLDVFRTATFRLAFAYLCLFAVSVLVLLGFIYWSIAGKMATQSDETINAEVQGLAEQYKRRLLPGLRAIIIERSSRLGQRTLYLLTSFDGTPLAGNLSQWPPDAKATAQNWINFTYIRGPEDDRETRPGRAVQVVLQGGFKLLVGRDVSEVNAVETTIRSTLLWALAITGFFGVAGGVWISRNVIRRLEVINRTSREIMSGDLTRRIPVQGNRDELDDLAKNLNEMLEQIERLMMGMREVADNIAHDLRTPLNRLRNKLEGAMIGNTSREETVQALESAIGEADGLISTFNSLLLIAEAETGAHRDTLELVDLNEIVRDIADLYTPAAEDRGISFKLLAASRVMVRGNRSLLARAAANLVENALKYTPEGGAVTVSTFIARDDDRPAFSVRDTGPGIPEDDRERVLDRFVRLERSRNTPGSGLGLSLVAAVARMHDATIALEDAKPGLLATLSFPRVETVLAPSIAAQARRVLPAPTKAQRAREPETQG
ncbi:MAG: HAMP domain-containing histidine kinase [Alphaproteobacteria bacterium]|nr:HAMP domain-containing histidine kinase [Alphaproteobacteria bacterium]